MDHSSSLNYRNIKIYYPNSVKSKTQSIPVHTMFYVKYELWGTPSLTSSVHSGLPQMLKLLMVGLVEEVGR